MNKTCKICSSRKHSLVWNDKIRVGGKKFSKKNFKILKCEICNLVSLEKPYLKFENDNQTFRKIFLLVASGGVEPPISWVMSLE